MLNEFKKFAMKGNMLDMAVGIIIGGAFDTIVKSLVSDVLMPPLGLLLGGMDFSKLKVVLQEAVTETVTKDGKAIEQVVDPEVAIRYGAFFDAAIAFLLVAFALFIVIKGVNKLKEKEEEAPAEPPAPPKEEVLLEEIRDLLKAQQG